MGKIVNLKSFQNRNSTKSKIEIEKEKKKGFKLMRNLET